MSKAEIQAIAAEDFDKLDEIMSLCVAVYTVVLRRTCMHACMHRLCASNRRALFIFLRAVDRSVAWPCNCNCVTPASRMDGDKDGSLSVKEFARFWPAVRRLRPENEALGAPLDNADDTREEASSSTKPNGGSWGVNLKSGKPKQKRNAGVIRAKASQAKKLFATRDDNSVSATTVLQASMMRSR